MNISLNGNQLDSELYHVDQDAKLFICKQPRCVFDFTELVYYIDKNGNEKHDEKYKDWTFIIGDFCTLIAYSDVTVISGIVSFISVSNNSKVECGYNSVVRKGVDTEVIAGKMSTVHKV